MNVAGVPALQNSAIAENIYESYQQFKEQLDSSVVRLDSTTVKELNAISPSFVPFIHKKRESYSTAEAYKFDKVELGEKFCQFLYRSGQPSFLGKVEDYENYVVDVYASLGINLQIYTEKYFEDKVSFTDKVSKFSIDQIIKIQQEVSSFQSALSLIPFEERPVQHSNPFYFSCAELDIFGTAQDFCKRYETKIDSFSDVFGESVYGQTAFSDVKALSVEKLIFVLRNPIKLLFDARVHGSKLKITDLDTSQKYILANSVTYQILIDPYLYNSFNFTYQELLESGWVYKKAKGLPRLEFDEKEASKRLKRQQTIRNKETADKQISDAIVSPLSGKKISNEVIFDFPSMASSFLLPNNSDALEKIQKIEKYPQQFLWCEDYHCYRSYVTKKIISVPGIFYGFRSQKNYFSAIEMTTAYIEQIQRFDALNQFVKEFPSVCDTVLWFWACPESKKAVKIAKKYSKSKCKQSTFDEQEFQQNWSSLYIRFKKAMLALTDAYLDETNLNDELLNHIQDSLEKARKAENNG